MFHLSGAKRACHAFSLQGSPGGAGAKALYHEVNNAAGTGSGSYAGTGDLTITFSAAGTYRLAISGTFPHFVPVGLTKEYRQLSDELLARFHSQFLSRACISEDFLRRISRI